MVTFLLKLNVAMDAVSQVSKFPVTSIQIREPPRTIGSGLSFQLFPWPFSKYLSLVQLLPPSFSSSLPYSSSSLSFSFCFVLWASNSQLVSLWEKNLSSVYALSTFTYTSYLLCHWLPLCTPPHFICVTGEIFPKIYKGNPNWSHCSPGIS